MDFKILFPTDYQINNILNDNIDINIVLSDGSVYWGVLYTLSNIEFLMFKFVKDGEQSYTYFSATDMLIVENLKKETIRKAISAVIIDGNINSIFTKIRDTYSENISFDKIEDMCV